MVSAVSSKHSQLTRLLCTGFYIHSCVKMKYKSDYQPSKLLDPETNVFYPWAHCKERLELTKHASFSKPLSEQPVEEESTGMTVDDAPHGVSKGSDDSEDAEDEFEWPSPSPPGCLDPDKLPKELLFGTCVLEGRTLVPLLVRAFVSGSMLLKFRVADALLPVPVLSCVARPGAGKEHPPTAGGHR